MRTKKGRIYKVAEITSYGICMNDSKDIFGNGEQFGSTICEEKDIKNHSKDIIDLVEAGDFVNGMLVVYVSKNEKAIKICFYNGLYIQTLKLVQFDIKSILTHEQYEQNCYRLEE